jgi:DegV family protein with EDD domain
MKIKISADSTGDLPKDIAEKYDIGIMPLYIINGDKSYIDGVDVTPEEIYRVVESGGGTFSTAAVNVADYHAAFKKWREDSDAVIHFTISSSMSACFNNARLAAEDLDGVYVVDSRSLSTGIGLLATCAARFVSEGLPAGEIFSRMEELREKLDVSFVVEKLDYLRRGGRCSALAAFGANLLKLKPCIELKDGAMDVGKKYRGGIDKAIAEYLTDKLVGRDDIDYSRIIITYSPTEPEIVEKAEEFIKNLNCWEQIFRARAGCTISNHCGPNTLGVIFLRK